MFGTSRTLHVCVRLLHFQYGPKEFDLNLSEKDRLQVCEEWSNLPLAQPPLQPKHTHLIKTCMSHTKKYADKPHLYRSLDQNVICYMHTHTMCIDMHTWLSWLLCGCRWTQAHDLLVGYKLQRYKVYISNLFFTCNLFGF